MNYRVFLSHSSVDYDIARYIFESARQIEVEVYLFEHDPQLGRNVTDKVKTEITNSDCMVVILSSSSQYSSYVQQEIGYAEGREKLIVPIVCPGFDVAKLSMLEGREYLHYDHFDPQLTMQKIQQFFLKKKKGKDIASGILWGIGLVLAGALIAKANE